MKPIAAKIPILYRRCLYSVLAVAWSSGILFFILSRFITVEGEFGPEKHPWQFSALKVHGAMAFLLMISFGVVLGAHMPAGWRWVTRRKLGLMLVIAVGLQVLSAYILYYTAYELFRAMVAYLHLAIGLILPGLLMWHVLKKRGD